jgi:hypothetical protein
MGQVIRLALVEYFKQPKMIDQLHTAMLHLIRRVERLEVERADRLNPAAEKLLAINHGQ